ncbi:hypothetical protein [Microbacterium oxydans]|uniref:hypothetical protein n=1 Tax=Microbacterium oxydans TaxID=82380 RepID=UPI00366C6009
MDEVRSELEALAAEASTFIDRRDAAVIRARDRGLTWDEIGRILGMTPHGLRKALNKRSEQS